MTGLERHGSAGADWAPRAALRVGSAAVLDCVGVRVSGERVVATRPCYGGNLLSEVAFRTRPAVITVRARSFDAATPHGSRRGESVRLPVDPDSFSTRTKIVSESRGEAGGPSLEDARVVVAGGRGLDGPEGFRMLETLADILGGAVGASRVACDLGWYPHTHQIGLTGRSIAPDLYVEHSRLGLAPTHGVARGSSGPLLSLPRDFRCAMQTSVRKSRRSARSAAKGGARRWNSIS